MFYRANKELKVGWCFTDKLYKSLGFLKERGFMLVAMNMGKKPGFKFQYGETVVVRGFSNTFYGSIGVIKERENTLFGNIYGIKILEMFEEDDVSILLTPMLKKPVWMDEKDIEIINKFF